MSLTVFFEVKIQIPTDLTAEECTVSTVDNAIQYVFRELEEMLGCLQIEIRSWMMTAAIYKCMN